MSKPYVYRRFVMAAELVDGLRRYVEDGVPLGDFLRACVENDFLNAIGRADETNVENLPAIAAYIYNEMPLPSHGSAKLYDAWLDKRAEWRRKKYEVENPEPPVLGPPS